jgi:hypothetical protein
MQLIIFCVALFALSGLTHYFFRDENSCYKSLRGCVWQVIWTAAVGAVVGTFTAAVVVPQYIPMTSEMSDPDTLVAMRGVQSDTGIFVLGSGTYNSSGAYRIFRKNTDGSVSPVDLRAERSLRIKEDAELKGVGYWRTEFSNFDKNSPLAPFAVGWFYDQAIVGQELRVPVGTVVQTFTTN